MTKAIHAGTRPVLPFDRSDPRQLRMFDDDFANRRELRSEIDALVREICGSNRSLIIALNAKLRAHYHPKTPPSACSTATLRSIIVGLQAERLSVAA